MNGPELAARLARIAHVGTHVAVGQSVSPHDRHNIGTVTGLDDQAGTVTVEFVSNNGREATRTFAWDELRIVEPAEAHTRPLTPAAVQRLTQIHEQLETLIERWNTVVRSFDVEPGDIGIYQRALDRRVERDANTLTAHRPDWLTHLLGIRPADVAGAHTWDDAVTSIATWRARHDLQPHTPGLGTIPTNTHLADEWSQLQQQLGATRVWLTSTDRLEPAWTVTPGYHELLRRRGELDVILDSAPPDHRHVIDRLRHGQLSFDDTTELLQTAVNSQKDRRAWIVEHWPDVVEYQEIQRTITTETWGPNPQLLDDLLDHDITNRLATAIRNDEPWLRPALCKALADDTTNLNNDAIGWLENIADYRAHARITTLEPLGPRPLDTGIADERATLWSHLNSYQPQTGIEIDYDLGIDL